MRYFPAGSSGGGGTASSITNTPSGNLSSTDVQAALNELQSDIDTRKLVPFDPTLTSVWFEAFDDFYNGVNGGEPYGQFGWDTISNGTGGSNVQQAPSTSERNHIGVWRMTCGTGVGNYGGIIASQSSFLFGDSTVTLVFRFKIVTLADATDDYSLRIGFSNTYPTIQHGAIFEYLRSSSTNWRLVTSKSSVTTTTTTSTAVDTNWHVARITVTNASTVDFYLDGVSLGQHTTNIPTSTGEVCGPTFVMGKSAGTANRACDIDFAYMRYKPGTARGTL